MSQPSSPRDPDSPVTPPSGRRWRRLLGWTIVVYTLVVLCLAAWMHARGDRAWLATIFLFGPRWFSAVPLLVLVPLAAIWHRRMLVLLAVALVTVLFGVLGLEVHFSSADAPYRVRILTCNLNQMRFPLGELNDLVATLNPDVVALQEVPYNPPPIDWPRGWHAVQFDKVIVASRHRVEPREHVNRPLQPNKPLAVRFLVHLPSGQVQFFNLHLTTPREGLSAVIDRQRGLDFSGTGALEESLLMRTAEARLVRDWIEDFEGPKFVVGDFNTPADGAIYRDCWSDFLSAYSTAGFGFGYTKQTGRGLLRYGTRIDHILYTPPWRCVRAWVAADIGSDHLPLVADFE